MNSMATTGHVHEWVTREEMFGRQRLIVTRCTGCGDTRVRVPHQRGSYE